jgi:hypothetical protein
MPGVDLCCGGKVIPVLPGYRARRGASILFATAGRKGRESVNPYNAQKEGIIMKRILATSLFLAVSSAAFAQAPEPVWRSPVGPGLGLGGTTPYTAEKNRQLREQDLAAWHAKHPKVATQPQADRPAVVSFDGRYKPKADVR